MTDIHLTPSEWESIPAESHDQTEYRAALREWIERWRNSLSRRQRQVAELYFYQHQTTRQIAATLGVRQCTVANAVALARNKAERLKAQLPPEYIG
jgi:RNA polymerase sigma factor (sigma-70 family)